MPPLSRPKVAKTAIGGVLGLAWKLLILTVMSTGYFARILKLIVVVSVFSGEFTAFADEAVPKKRTVLDELDRLEEIADNYLVPLHRLESIGGFMPNWLVPQIVDGKVSPKLSEALAERLQLTDELQRKAAEDRRDLAMQDWAEAQEIGDRLNAYGEEAQKILSSLTVDRLILEMAFDGDPKAKNYHFNIMERLRKILMKFGENGMVCKVSFDHLGRETPKPSLVQLRDDFTPFERKVFEHIQNDILLKMDLAQSSQKFCEPKFTLKNP